jgi:hypothetical protein
MVSLLDAELTEHKGYPKGHHGNKVSAVERMAQVGSVSEPDTLLLARVTRPNGWGHLRRSEGPYHRRLLRVKSWIWRSLRRLTLGTKELASFVHDGFPQPYLPIDGTVLHRIDDEAGYDYANDDLDSVDYK